MNIFRPWFYWSFLTLRDSLREWRVWSVAMEFFFPFVCFEFLPNVKLRTFESLLRSDSLHKAPDTFQLRCREVNVNVSAAPCIISSGWRVSPFVMALRLHCVIVHVWTAVLIVHWSTALWVYPTRVLCGLQRTPLKALTDWPLFLAFLS